MKVYVQTEEISVNCLPPDIDYRHHWALKVKYYSGPGKYVVQIHQHLLVNKNGEPTMKPQPKENLEETQLPESEYHEYLKEVGAWKDTVYMDLDEALRLAREYAPKVIVNGYTPEMVLKQENAL
jgi:hypothetical protein